MESESIKLFIALAITWAIISIIIQLFILLIADAATGESERVVGYLYKNIITMCSELADDISDSKLRVGFAILLYLSIFIFSFIIRCLISWPFSIIIFILSVISFIIIEIFNFIFKVILKKIFFKNKTK